MKGMIVTFFPAARIIPNIHPDRAFIRTTWLLPVHGTHDLFKRLTFSLGLN